MSKKMERVLAIDIPKKVGSKIRLLGWIEKIRDHGKISFVDFRDRSAVVQCVGKNLPKLTVESVIEIVGEVALRPKELINKNLETGKFEVKIEEVKILSLARELPIPLSQNQEEVSLRKRLDWRWLDLRKKENLLVFRVWTAFEAGFRDYLEKSGYLQIYAPSFMSTASESGAEVFKVQYFDKEAYLAQSPQFFKQAAMAAGFEKVFMTGPVFRAEPSFTTRHMTEFTGWDFELSFIEDHFAVMAEEEKALIAGFERVEKDLGLGIGVPKSPFPKITLSEAKQKLKKMGVVSEKDSDLNPEEEEKISQLIKKEEGHDFVFITDYPIVSRPFYHMRHGKAKELTRSFDLLYKGLEVTTGAQREHRIEILESQAQEKGMSLKALENYLNFFRFGCPPHGGVGIGPGRIIMKMLNLKSVKEAAFFPRDVKRLTP